MKANGLQLRNSYSHTTAPRDRGGFIYNALEKGRGKYRNVYIHGPANCGKLFIVWPLKVIYKVFSNSVTGSFAWIGAEEAKIIYLNDFWWHPKMMLVKGGAIDRVNTEMMNCQWFFPFLEANTTCRSGGYTPV